MPIEYSKLEGSGNEYVAIDGRNVERNWAKLAIAISIEVSGVGSDGIVLVQDSDRAQIRMRVYNPDGSEAEMSGNGIRLFAKFVLDRQLVEFNDDGTLVIETGGGLRTVWPTIKSGKMVSARVSMGQPTLAPKHIPVVVRLLAIMAELSITPLNSMAGP
jgi:diaminopimelate epimerase